MTDGRADFDDLGDTDAMRRARYVVADWMVGLPLVLVEALVDLGAESVLDVAGIPDRLLLDCTGVGEGEVQSLRGFVTHALAHLQVGTTTHPASTRLDGVAEVELPEWAYSTTKRPLSPTADPTTSPGLAVDPARSRPDGSAEPAAHVGVQVPEEMADYDLSWIRGLTLTVLTALFRLNAYTPQAAAALSDEALLDQPHIGPGEIALLRRHLAALPAEPATSEPPPEAGEGSDAAAAGDPWAVPAPATTRLDEVPASDGHLKGDPWAASRRAVEEWRSESILPAPESAPLSPARAAEQERLQRILDLREAGLTLDEIGKEYDITRERVRQIIAATDFDDSPERQQERRARADTEEWLHAIVPAALADPERSLADLLATYPAPGWMSKGEIADLLSTHLGGAGFIARRARQSGPRAHSPEERAQARESAAQHLRQAAADLGVGPMPHGSYSEWRSTHPGAYSAQNIIRLFGTWTLACRAAGIHPGDTTRPSYTRGWMEEDCAGFVWLFLSEERAGSFTQYEAWARQHPTAPSGGTVRNILGGWTEALAEAAEYAIDQGLDTPAVPLGPPRYRLAYASVIERSRPRPGTDDETPHDEARLDRTSDPGAEGGVDPEDFTS